MKTFDALSVGSLVSGIALVQGMGRMQELVEHLAGHPVWTHELADRAFVGRMRQQVLSAHPAFPPAVVNDDWQDYAKRVTALFPEGLAFPEGNEQRVEHPLNSLLRVREDAATR